MSREKGQTLVEFALILPILLLILFIIIESGRIFQAYITVQHAAREGARYAVTGRWEEEFAGEEEKARVFSIEDIARNALAGLALAGPAGYDEEGRILTGHYEIKIFGQNPNPPPALLEGYAGLPGEKVAVQVAYRLQVITPVLNAIAPSVPVVGYVEMINEDFGQLSAGGFPGLREPPSPIPPEIPTAGASPTPTETPTGTVTPTPTETGTPTETATPSSTPACTVHIEGDVHEYSNLVTVSGNHGDLIELRDMDDGGVLLGTRTINDPGHYCAGQVGFPVNLSEPNRLGHIIAAIAINRPSSDTTCVGVTACWDTPTPTATGTTTPTPTPTPIEPYIVLNRACSPVGEPVDIRVRGFNWAPDPSKHILLKWVGPGDPPHYQDQETLDSRASWSYVIGLAPHQTIEGTHTVRALQVETGEEDIKYLEVPCPATPTPTITATPLRPDLHITDIAVSPPGSLAAYQPVTFTVTIKNDGPGDALSLFWVDLYDLPDGHSPPTAGQSEGDVAWTALGSLGAEDTKTVVLYYSFIDSGARDVYGYVDTRQNVDEIDEGNNARGPLELTISAGTPPSSTLTTDPVCSAEGVSTTITVRGQAWPDTGTIQILYDGSDKGSFASQANWTQPIIISGTSETGAGTHIIRAVHPLVSVPTDYYIPCSGMATIDGYTWIFIKGDIVPHGRTDVYCYDDGGNLIAQTTSDEDSYYNMKIPPGVGPYTVIGKTYVNDVLYRDAKAGVSASVGVTTTVNLVLVPQY
jgi:hypothetical protein